MDDLELTDEEIEELQNILDRNREVGLTSTQWTADDDRDDED